MASSAQPVPIKLPPGMFRNGTEYETSGRWYDGNLVRWENGTMKPVGGWQNMLPGFTFVGMARGGIAWVDNNSFRYTAIGTDQKLYINQERGPFTDYTPAMITAGFSPGRGSSIGGIGYGSGSYGHDVPPTGLNTYGTPRTTISRNLTDASTWAMDTLGQDLVAVMNSDGHLWQWSPGASAVVIPAGSPVNNLAVMVTNEDYVLLLGAGGQARKIQWPDIGTTTIWTPSSTNSAGSIQLNSSGKCRAGARVGLENLVWTDVDVHKINYVGLPAVYGPTRIAEGCGLVGANAYAVTDVAYWWSHGGFFRYNGVVQPMDCEVQDYIFKNTNFLQAAKIYGEINSRFNEVTWHFPSISSIENDSYVTFNYKMNVWSFGIQSALGARTVWIDRGPFPSPMAVSPSGIIYEHEIGYLADGVSRVGQVFARSGPAEIGNGEQIIYSNMLLPDGVNTASLTMTTRTRFTPQGLETVGAPIPLIPNAEGYVPLRIVGRQVAVQLNAVADTDWAMGKPRLKVASGGGR